ncbi:hypothetical protein Tcan_11595 [Toxocara canis]|uniref:Uncharacterized protein n=1 Tax=Toxocara canis TaxID=6265 RepID=A0A0B2VYM1_TOXCA|nr:hypothetical protein Tcan_11595 [Toxocara canis]
MDILASSSTILYDKPIDCGVIRNVTDITVFDCIAITTVRLCILLLFGAIIIFCCATIAVRIAIKSRLRKQKQQVFVVDAPPSYSDIMPPSYEWAIKHMNTKKLYQPSDLVTENSNASQLLN